MKEDNKWIQQVRRQLEDYSEPLPTGLWEAIEKDLNHSSVQPKVIPLWRRWQTVAAAVVAVLLVSSTAVWLLYDVGGLPTERIPLVADVPSPEPTAGSRLSVEKTATTPESVVEQVSQGAASLLAAVTSSSVLPDSSPAENIPVVTDVNPVAFSVDDSADSKEEAESSVAGSMDTMERKRASQRKADREQLSRNALFAVAEKSSVSHNWQIGLTTGNSFSSVSNSFQGLSTLMTRNSMLMSDDLAMNPMNDNGMAYTQVLFHNRDQVTETRIRHRMPMTVGAILSYAFSDRWSLETGLTYTLLSSELHTGEESYIEEEQKLHYVGIPLKVKYSFWKNDWLTVYALAGGAVEKCVSGSLETVYVTGSSDRKAEHTSLDIKALQWSVNAAVGGQFNLTRQLGLYIEPGLAYYFDDGSGIETYRKKHPCNFNLQLGVRFTLPK